MKDMPTDSWCSPALTLNLSLLCVSQMNESQIIFFQVSGESQNKPKFVAVGQVGLSNLRETHLHFKTVPNVSLYLNAGSCSQVVKY